MWIRAFPSIRQAYDAVLITTAGLEPPEPLIVYANPAFEAMSGYSAAEVIGRSPRLLQGPRTDRAVLASLKETLGRGEGFTGQAVNYRKDGGEYIVEWIISPLPDVEGRITHWVAVLRDLGAGKEKEENLRLEEEKLQEAIRRAALEWRLTFDAIASPVLLLETDGRIIRMNEAARSLAGVTYESVIQHPLRVLGASELWQTVSSLLEEAASAQPAAAQQLDEQGRTWDVSVSPVVGPDGQRWQVVVMLDVTDLVKLQESLRRSETMSAMGALVAGVSHEVRNPLFGISATLDAFESRFQEKGEYRRYFEILQGEVKRLSALMQQLLDYGKPLRLELTEVPVQEIAAVAIGACLLRAQAEGVEIDLEIAPEVPSLMLDRNRVVQVFQNLVENAVQHSPRGGRISFRVERAERGDHEAVRFTVEDSGPGFRGEDLARIFEPFFTRRRGGTGLGLSIVQRIVEQHGGEIEAANLPAGGAAMAVTLPLDPRAAASDLNGSEGMVSEPPPRRR